jgi:hypothetical protein
VLAFLAHNYKSVDHETLHRLENETVNKKANADK